MTRSVVFRPQAEDELLEVQRRYEGRREGLGDERRSSAGKDARVGLRPNLPSYA